MIARLASSSTFAKSSANARFESTAFGSSEIDGPLSDSRIVFVTRSQFFFSGLRAVTVLEPGAALPGTITTSEKKKGQKDKKTQNERESTSIIYTHLPRLESP